MWATCTTTSSATTICWTDVTEYWTDVSDCTGTASTTTVGYYPVTATTTATTTLTSSSYVYYPVFREQVTRELVARECEMQQQYAREMQAAAARRRREQEAIDRRCLTDAADRRARALLLEHLTDEQRATMKKHGWFVVIGGKSGRRYRIRTGTLVGNVDLIAANDNNRVEVRLCGHCRYGAVASHDHYLAQKLMLEASEDEFLRIANRHAA